MIAAAVAAPTDSDKETYVYNERFGNNFAYATYEGKPYKYLAPFQRTYVRQATLYEPGYAAQYEYPYFYAPAYYAPESYYYYKA